MRRASLVQRLLKGEQVAPSSSPLVSVVMAARNAAPYIREAVDSLLASTLPAFELIVVNDASEDATADALAAYTDPRIRVQHNEVALGVASALNDGIRLASGRYIARLDADDLAHPQRLEWQVALLETRSDIGVVGSNAEYIDGSGRRFRLPPSKVPVRHEAISWHLLAHNCIIHPTVMLRRDVLERLGGYPAVVGAEDYALWLGALEITSFHNIDRVLVRYRTHRHNVSRLRHGPANVAPRLAARLTELLGRRVMPRTAHFILDPRVAMDLPAAEGEHETALVVLHDLFRAAETSHRLMPQELARLRQELVRIITRLLASLVRHRAGSAARIARCLFVDPTDVLGDMLRTARLRSGLVGGWRPSPGAWR